MSQSRHAMSCKVLLFKWFAVKYQPVIKCAAATSGQHQMKNHLKNITLESDRLSGTDQDRKRERVRKKSREVIAILFENKAK